MSMTARERVVAEPGVAESVHELVEAAGDDIARTSFRACQTQPDCRHMLGTARVIAKDTWNMGCQHVMTVRGPVATAELGLTLQHEHLLWDQTGLWRGMDSAADNSTSTTEPLSTANVWLARARPYVIRDNLVCEDVQLIVAELQSLHELGGRTVVDVTSIGLGRYPRQLQQISRETGLHVIAGTGYYFPALIPAADQPRTVAQACEQMMTDLTVGMAGTDVRAGIIAEIALGGQWESERLILEAAAQAHLETGAPIGFHSSADMVYNRKCLDLLVRNGVPPDKTVFYHMDRRSTTVADIATLAAQGAYVSLDRFGYGEFLMLDMKTYLPTDAERIAVLLELFARGLGARLLLSHDLAYKHMLTRYGGYGYAHIPRDVVPVLRNHGLAQADLDLLLVQNPRRLFG